MEYLRLESVSKRFGHKLLFEDLNLTIRKGDKVALIAKNGTGKSTLLRMAVGMESPEGEHARIHLNKRIKVTYLSQDPYFDPQLSVFETLMSQDSESLRALADYHAALSSENDKRIEEAILIVEDLGAWDVENRAKEILFKLHLPELEQAVGTLSGGEKKRLALAGLVFNQPDLLILDEPTNHLDIEIIEWLEKYLMASQLTLLMVTHDRYFMERLCNSIIELDKGRIYKYDGNYSDYLLKKALREEQESTQLDKAKKLYLKELDWVRRQPQARGTKPKARVDEYEKLKNRLSDISFEDVFEVPIKTTRLGKKVVEFFDVGKSFPDKVLIEDFWYKFKSGEKIGVCGPNGSGKTTLIKLIIGELKPDIGKRVVGDTVVFGHYNQDGIPGSENKRVIDLVRDVAEFIPLEKGQKLTAVQLLEKFMFPREMQEIYISELSGGERKRLHLLTVLMGNPNFLILDEPTNDLDVLTLNVLENYLLQFSGCVLIVSHDRYFMDKIVDHMFIFAGNGQIEDFNGTYTQWRERKKNTEGSSAGPQKSAKRKPDKPTKEKGLSYLEKKEMNQIESKVETLENRRKQITEEFGLSGLSPAEIEDRSRELARIQKDIDEMELRWLELSERL